ncbi:hypothetical protein Tco_0685954 [Tanacetum coccineum]
MVAYLEKSDENAEFHQIVDFLSICSINYALTAVVITESSVRNDLLFYDEDGITCLTNDEIFENLALMGWQSQASRNHRGAPAQTRSERVLKQPNEPPLPKGHISGSGEGRMEHTFELIDIVLDLEKEKDAQAVKILKLKKRVKKLERQRKSSISHPKRRIYRQVESSDDDLDEEDASKQGRTSDKTKPMFNDSNCDDLNDLVDEGMENQGKIGADDTEVVKGSGDTEAVNTAGEGEEKGVAIKDVEDFSRPIRSITTLQPILTIDPKDKGKGVLVKEEPEKSEKVKRRDQGLAQIESDAELAQRLHEEELAELDRAQKEKQKQEEATNAALAKEFDEIQARTDVDHELAPMDSEEDGSNTKKDGKRIKRIADSTSKQKSPKKSKVIKEQESTENKDETVDLDLLSVKYPIVDYESQNLGSVDMEDIHVYKIIKADGNTNYHKTFSSMLKKVDRQDLMDLHILVMKRLKTIPQKVIICCFGENTRVHSLLMDGTLTCFNMLVEKIYPLIKEILKKMLNWKLEAEAESTMAFDLLKFINAADEDSLKQSKFTAIMICHMGSHTLQQLKIYSFDELKELFETTMKNVNTFVPMETEDRGRASELAAGSSQATIIDSAEVGSSKRAAEAELDHEGSKRQKTNEASGSVQEQPEEEEKELSQEDLQQMMMVVPVEEVYVEALQDMLKVFDRDDLVMLWNLVKERFSSIEPTDDKERTLWVELKRLFEPNTDDTLWKLQRYMHDPLKWRLYDTCGVYHMSTERGIDIFMPVEKEYLLSKGVLTLMLVNKLLVEQHSEMANELVRKIFIQANRPRQ